MAGQKTISTTYTPSPQPPEIISLLVTGDPNPDCKGDYFPNGLIDGRMSYLREDALYHTVYSSALQRYYIANNPGGVPNRIWSNDTDDIAGDYTYIPPALGVATVTPVY
jgi:hypothetical protein